MVDGMLWEHLAVGSIPAFPTDVEISVVVNTIACDAVNMGSIPLSQPNGQVADLVYASD